MFSPELPTICFSTAPRSASPRPRELFTPSLYALGHRDLMDDLLYGIAVSRGMKFLATDEALKKFVREHGYADVFIGPKDL
jgi:hypothetical protein